MDYSVKLVHSLTGQLERIPLILDQKAVHLLRIKIKRIRSLLKLIRFSDKKNEIHEPEFLSGLFKLAGKLRESQIEKLLLRKVGTQELISLKAYFKSLDREEKYYRKMLHEHLAKINQVKIYQFGQELIVASSGVTKTGCHKFIKKTCSKMRRLTQARVIKRKQIHGFRKRLKDVLFAIEFAMHDKTDTFFDQEQIEKVLKLQNLIGKWHDSRVAVVNLKLLEFASKSQKDKDISVILSKFKKNELRQFKEVKKRCIKAVKKI